MLNPELFQQLSEEFEEVEVINEDMPMELVEYPDEKGETRYRKMHGGEQYRMNCPCCLDKRGRLYVSHAYGMESKLPVKAFVVCHNEHCEQNRELSRNPRAIIDRLCSGFFNDIRLGISAVPKKLDDVYTEAKTFKGSRKTEFPETEACVGLLTLPKDHYVVEYLEARRKLDLQTLDRYMVVWVPEFNRLDPKGKSLAWLGGRVFIPVLSEVGVIEGWQARIVGDHTKKQKYFNAPGWSKSRSLYGAYQDDYPVALICEGVTDVYRLGAGVCTFGKTISPEQAQMIKRKYGKCAILFDPDTDVDTQQSATKAFRQMRRALGPGGVVRIPLPGVDVADMEKEDAWKLVRRELEKADMPNPEPKYGCT